MMTTTTTTTAAPDHGYGTLYEYATGDEIRAATADELAASRAAGDAGVILVDLDDGRTDVRCYVVE